jgi:hypothetical protein
MARSMSLVPLVYIRWHSAGLAVETKKSNSLPEGYYTFSEQDQDHLIYQLPEGFKLGAFSHLGAGARVSAELK